MAAKKLTKKEIASQLAWHEKQFEMAWKARDTGPLLLAENELAKFKKYYKIA